MADWPKLEAAWQAFSAGKTNMPTDSDEALALEYIEALGEKDRAEQRLERAKTALLAAGPRKVAGMLDIVQTNAKGRVSWEKAARAAGVDDAQAEFFRGEGSTRTSIKVLAK